MSLSIKTNDDYEMSIEYEVEEDSAKAYEAEIKVAYKDYWDDESYKMSISWDKKAGDFEFKGKSDYSDFSLEGTLNKKGDKYIFVLEKIKSDGYSVDGIDDLELTITVDTRDPAPKAPSRYTDIILMEEDDFEDLFEEIEDGIEDIEDEFF